MNRLPSSTSFQGVLDSIIRNYLLNELPPEAENGNARHLVAEKDLGLLQGNGLHLHNPHFSATSANVQSEAGGGAGGDEVNNNARSPIPGTSTAANAFTSTDHEYIKAVYQCFEKRGVFKELQTFLRHKLVSILQDEWPNLQMPVSASQNEEPNTIVYRLVDDFLRCHKLLYTLSVLASESDVKSQSTTRVLYGKLSSKETEDLLDEMGIKRDSRLSGQILKCYFDKENFSLLESMHYLGIWIDDSSIQLDCLQQEDNGTKQRKRIGSGGESIILRQGKRCKEKATETVSIDRNESIREKLGEKSKVGVEQRLLELEKNLEKEKEFKIKEAIEKYKREEQVKLREELETKFKLLLVEKEKEHFLAVQKRMDEMNAETQRERKQWMDAKLKQEEELLEFRKKLSEMMNASGDHNNWRNPSTANPISNVNGEQSQQQYKATATNTATKTSQTTLDDPSPYKCSCRKHSPPYRFSTRETASNYHHHSILNSIEQDRLAFLQYRMEQQDNEIQALQRQLLFSAQMPTSKQKMPPVSFVEERRNGNSQQESNGQQGEKSSPTLAGSTTPRSDDLATFLTESRSRVQKLDTAVDKIDEIVQELFSKRRSPLSKEVSSHILASTINKSKTKPSLSQLHSSLHNMSTVNAFVLPPMNFPSTPVPLVHQQVPERQKEKTPSFLQSSPFLNYSTVFDLDSDLFAPMPMNHYPSPPPLFGLRKQPESSALKSPSADRIVANRPHTPVDKTFEIAYGESMRVFERQIMESGIFKKSSPETLLRRASTNGNDNDVDNRQTYQQASVHESDEVEESLFHVAARNNANQNIVVNSSDQKQNVNETLEEKAIRKGALSRERIISSDEGDNENSLSTSLPLSGTQKATKHILKPIINNGVHNTNMLKAISKRKMSDTIINKVEDPQMKAVAGKGPATLASDKRRESLSNQLVQSKHNSSVSSSSSSSRKAISITKSRDESHVSIENRKQQTDDDDQSSMSISVPKSIEGEGNNEDFWQL